MELKDKSLQTLELPAVLALLAREAVSDPAKERSLALSPASDRHEVARRLRETTAAKAMLAVKGSPSFSGVKDVRASLARADMGGSLNPRELLEIAGVLQSARQVRAYADAEGEGESGQALRGLFHDLQANRFLEDKLYASVTGEEEIADAASGELADIRRKIRAANARIRDALQKIIGSPTYAKALQDSIITQRSGRYVVPVKAEYKGSVPGLVHDVSASGATLFVEPMAAVKANNELRELHAQEKQEIERILAELSADCAAHGEDITADFQILVTLDVIFAKARLSERLNCTEPELTDRKLDLKKARHPLLDQAKAVPIDVELGARFDTLVITGPNTGGKTVSLKTLGLLSAMALCGLHIPAAEGSCLPVFEKILADIGDEQSIEQSLSTFSAHMTTIVRILAEAGPGCLLLFDELGAGTDPTEGAALAVAMIEYARKRGAMVAATTHYAELKLYAANQPGVQNASCEFDVDSLRPTYRLLIGVPGKSNAFAISARLGLPEEIIQDARSRVGSESAAFEATIEKLEQQRQHLEQETAAAQERRAAAEADARKAARLRAELQVRLDKAEEKARRDAQRLLAGTRAEVDAALAELDELRKRAADEKNYQAVNEARAALRRRLNAAEEKLAGPAQEQLPEIEAAAPNRPIRAGDTVLIRAMGVKAQVISVSADGALQLQAGILRLNAKAEDVTLLAEETRAKAKAKEKAAASAGVTLRTQAMKPELDLRGMETLEAIPVMERFLDSASLARLETVTIIHGKGTGALRQAVQQALRKNKLVKSFRLGRYGEGESGVTIVELK